MSDARIDTWEQPIQAQMRIGDAWQVSDNNSQITDPYRGGVVTLCPVSNAANLDDALDAARTAFPKVAEMPAYERAAILRRAQLILAERAPDIARLMSRETGKAITDSLAELDRAYDTIGLSAEEAVRIEGEHVPLDASAMGAGKIALMLRFPVGVVAAITPFNAPVNLAAHKIAPAFAAGNSIVLKAPPQSPGCVHALVKVFVDAGAPAGSINLLFGDEVGPLLVRDPRVDFVTFTGSSKVGEDIKSAVGLKRVALELGGAGPVIVAEDTDIQTSASLCARNSMRLAGQSCISVQNAYVHESILGVFTEALVEAVARLKLGDPLDPDTEVGTLIDEAAARRVEGWVQDAVASGAKLLSGGTRNGAQFAPTILAGVPADCRVFCDEVFGPVINLIPYENLDDPIAMINASRFGLQCGILTKSLSTAMKVVRKVRTGGVIVGGTSTWRTDQLPYGGIKDSGIGREGPRYAIRDLTDQRLVVFNE